MQICVKNWDTREVVAEVVVEPENSVAFLKHRLFELRSDAFPRCRQYLHDGDQELEDEEVLEEYEMPDEHTIYYREAWYEPYCPGCSDCQRNFCTACSFYPINRGILWPEPRPYCSVCNQGPDPAAEPATTAAHADTTQEADLSPRDLPGAPAPISTRPPWQPEDNPDSAATLVDHQMLLSDLHLNQRVPTSDGTIITRPYESLSAPLDQRMLWSDIWMNQAENVQDPWATSLPAWATSDITVNTQGDQMPNRPVIQARVVAPLAEPALSANDPPLSVRLGPQNLNNLPPPDAWAPFGASRRHEVETAADNSARNMRAPTYAGFRAQHTSTRSMGAGTASTPSAQGSSQIAQLRSAAHTIQGQIDVLINGGGVDSVQQQMEHMRHDNQCCICLMRTNDSQLLPCMHDKFCKACIEQHLATSNHCPICRAAVRGLLTSCG